MLTVGLVRMTENPEELCGIAASICTGSTDSQRALTHALASGHTSVLEHVAFTFRAKGLSRAAMAQLTRHRLASFDVQSQRYVAVGPEELVIPKSIQQSRYHEAVASLMAQVMELYRTMSQDGIPKEDARYITPQAAMTEVLFTMNARELRHFFSLRTCNRAQWEIRELADAMLCICKKMCPGLFEDAGPACVNGSCQEQRPCGTPRTREDWG